MTEDEGFTIFTSEDRRNASIISLLMDFDHSN
jgi:hypothetical protein